MAKLYRVRLTSKPPDRTGTPPRRAGVFVATKCRGSGNVLRVSAQDSGGK
ncbi:hypothetical protein ACFPK5_34505 [Streptomyces beijiangensis]